MALDVSGRCNLRCVYCAESITMPDRQPMPERILHQAVDATFRWSKARSMVSFHIGSGEPLLRPRSVVEIGRRARRWARVENRPFALHLTTNGVLLSNAIMSQLVEDGWNVKISVDGTAEIHDRFRVDKGGRGTFKMIERAVRVLAATIPERFSTTAVLCHLTDPQQVFYGIASMGVRNIELVSVATPPSSPLALSTDDLTAYRRFVFDYAQRVVNGEEIAANIRFIKRLRRVMGYGNARIPCGAGRTFFATGPDGTLYPCFRFVGLRDYEMGNLEGGIRPDRVRWFTRGPGRSYEHRAECKRCWAAVLCGGPCFACAEMFGSGSPASDFCEMVRSESQAAIWLVDALREKHPDKLLSFLEVQLER